MKTFMIMIALIPSLALAEKSVDKTNKNTGLPIAMELLAKDHNTPIGTLELNDSPYGLLITPHLKGLTPGLHGFHIHENPDCGASTKDGAVVLGGKAGGHLDPSKTGKHLGPYSDEGHLGDLPPLYVDPQGNANLEILAPRLDLSKVMGHSFMIHMHGDNFSDTPESLGGGGPRMACGVFQIMGE